MKNYLLSLSYSVIIFLFGLKMVDAAVFPPSQNSDYLSPDHKNIQSLEYQIFDPLLYQRDLSEIDNSYAQSLASKGAEELDKGNRNKGLKLLTEAWEITHGAANIGIILSVNYLQEKEYKKTLEITSKLRRRYPQLSDAYVLAGIAYLGLNKKENAVEILNDLLEVVPGEAEASYNLAILEMRDGNYTLASKFLEKALLHNPKHFRLIKALAQLKLLQGDVSGAEELLLRTIELYPNSSMPVLELAKLYFNNKDYYKTINLINKKIDRYIVDKDLALMLVKTYIKTNEAKKAESVLLRALKPSSESSELIIELAWVYQKLNRFSDAISILGKIDKSDVEYNKALFVKSFIFYKKGDLIQSKKIIKNLLLLHNDDPYLLELAGNISLAEKRNKQAVNYFEKAFKHESTNIRVVQLAVAHVRNNNLSEAFTILENWLKTNPSDIFTLNALADLAIEQNKPEVALKQYKSILKLNPDDSLALNNVAFILNKKGQKKKALINIEKAITLNPSHPNIMDTKAEIHLGLGEYDKAIALFEKILQMNSLNLNVTLKLAKALAQSGQNARAKEILKQLLTKNTTFAEENGVRAILDGI